MLRRADCSLTNARLYFSRASSVSVFSAATARKPIARPATAATIARALTTTRAAVNGRRLAHFNAAARR